MRSLHCAREVWFALSVGMLTGCLLTSDFDGISTPEQPSVPANDAQVVVPNDAPLTPPEADTSVPPVLVDASSGDAAPDAADAAIWQPTPCTGRLECLSFDDALPSFDETGWRLDQAGSGLVLYDPGPGAMHAYLSKDTTTDTDSRAVLYKNSNTVTPSAQFFWGFDARFTACPGNDVTGDAVTLSSLQPASGALYGLASATEGDLLVVVPVDVSQPAINFALPALPRDRWMHLDFAVEMSTDATAFRIALDGVELRSVVVAGDAPSTSTLLNVGVLAKKPADECDAVFDNYYFDHVDP